MTNEELKSIPYLKKVSMQLREVIQMMMYYISFVVMPEEMYIGFII